MEKYPDSFYYERAQRLNCSKNAIFLAVHKFGFTHKKNHPDSPSKQADIPLKKEEFKLKLNELSKNKKVVYLDESGFIELVDRSHGYSLKGVPCGGLKLQNHHISPYQNQCNRCFARK